MLYELRRYSTRVASFGEFMVGFEQDLVPLLQESGFDLVAAWTVEIGSGGSSDLIWLLRWSDLGRREAAFASIRNDPRNEEFKKRFGKHINATSSQLLRSASFSPLDVQRLAHGSEAGDEGGVPHGD